MWSRFSCVGVSEWARSQKQAQRDELVPSLNRPRWTFRLSSVAASSTNFYPVTAVMCLRGFSTATFQGRQAQRFSTCHQLQYHGTPTDPSHRSPTGGSDPRAKDNTQLIIKEGGTEGEERDAFRTQKRGNKGKVNCPVSISAFIRRRGEDFSTTDAGQLPARDALQPAEELSEVVRSSSIRREVSRNPPDSRIKV